MKMKISFIGGDKRQYFMVKQLRNQGIHVKTYGLEGMENEKTIEETLRDSKILILPIPVGTILDELDLTDTGIHMLFGGMLSEEFVEECSTRGIAAYDFMKLPGIAEKNAVATAEGAILEAISHSVINLEGSNSLVIGYGKCGTVLARKLRALGSQVSVMVRRKEVGIQVEKDGYQAVGMQGMLRKYDYIFNTVPALVLHSGNLFSVKSDVTIIDLASKPGGVDFEYCQKKQIPAGLYLGLPGKYAPKTSAGILLDAVKQVMAEQKSRK